MKSQQRRFLTAILRYALTAAIVLASVHAAEALTFSVTDLTSLAGGANLSPCGISSNGLYVAGTVNRTDGTHAFRYDVVGGTITDLSIAKSWGTGVNDSGKVVGYYTYDTEPETVGWKNDLFIWPTTGSAIVTPVINSGSVKINNNGEIAGEALIYHTDAPAEHNLLYYSDGVVDNQRLPNHTPMVGGINDDSWIAGTATVPADPPTTPASPPQAFVDRPGTTSRETVWLQFPSGSGNSSANGINKYGAVVGGVFTASGSQHAYVSVPAGAGYSSPEDLGTLFPMGSGSSCANGINDNGWIVGQSDTLGFLAVPGAIKYSMRSLNSMLADKDWQITNAIGVANNGTILASGRYRNGAECQVLLTPVPEPSTFVLLVVAAVGLLGWARRQRLTARSAVSRR